MITKLLANNWGFLLLVTVFALFFYGVICGIRMNDKIVRGEANTVATQIKTDGSSPCGKFYQRNGDIFLCLINGNSVTVMLYEYDDRGIQFVAGQKPLAVATALVQ